MSLTTDEIDRWLHALYGEVPWSDATGVLHVAAIVDSSRAVIVPGREAPVSETDRFVLAAARARSDAILTTGAILRSEPWLCHQPAESEADNRAFRAWRRDRLGKTNDPLLVVLSASGDLPVDHPALIQASGGFVWTTTAGADRLRERVGSRIGCLELVEGAPGESGIRGAIAEILERPGVETVLIEAGPTASAALYPRSLDGDRRSDPNERVGERLETAIRCDELLLDRFVGELADGAAGPPFVSPAAVEMRFSRPLSQTRVRDSSGIWWIARYRES